MEETKTKLSDEECVKRYFALKKSRKADLTMAEAFSEMKALDNLQSPEFGFSTAIVTDIALRTADLRRLIVCNIQRFDVAVAAIISIFNDEQLSGTEPKHYEL